MKIRDNLGGLVTSANKLPGGNSSTFKPQIGKVFAVIIDENTPSKEIFEKNINDERLKSESQRDVILGKLAITHLAELQGDDIDSVILKYASVLAELNMPTYDGMDSKLRLANIHKAVAKNIYLSN